MFYNTVVLVVGEESVGDCPDLTNETRVVALLDMIDGTDLLALNVSNWCSAIVFFYPPEQKILAALIGHPSGNIYYASAEEDGAFRLPPKTTDLARAKPLPGPRQKAGLDRPNLPLLLENARLCVYGQKPKNFLSLFENQGLHRRLTELRRLMDSKEDVRFRIYNLAGNPMMANLAQSGMDAVIDLLGQHAHDVVPGAFIAQKAGAVVRGLDGAELNLGAYLLNPSSARLTYILAASEPLYLELQEVLTNENYKLYDAYDAGGAHVGRTTKRVIDELGLWRACVHVFLFDEADQLLICRRKLDAVAYPSLWTSSAGGHLEVGETYKDAAKRELKEELDIDDTHLLDWGSFDVHDGHGRVRHRLFAATNAAHCSISNVGPEHMETRWIRPTPDLQEQVRTSAASFANPFLSAFKLYLQESRLARKDR